MSDTVHALFEAQVARTPDAVATSMGSDTLTFRELDARANRLAHHLVDRGVGVGDLVALGGGHSIDLCVSMFGALKAGAAYVRLDPAQPAARLRRMWSEARPGFLVADDDPVTGLGFDAVPTVSLGRDGSLIERELASTPAVAVGGDHPVCVQYTSGSTGSPKGVRILHRGVVNRYRWQWRAYPARPGEVCSEHPFGPLLHGVRNVVVPAEDDRDWHRRLGLYGEAGVSRVMVAPSTLRTLLETYVDLGDRLPAARLWFAAGEILDADVVRAFHRCLPGRTLVNLYGTTEATADATWFETGTDVDGPVPIGRPLPGVRIHVLDTRRRPVAAGEVGELYVGGVGVAAGYVGRPELTERSFVDVPFDPGPLYRTGDRGRRRSDGNFEILGRIDDQLQIRGFRIEPAEVERALREDPDVLDAAVAKHGDELVAYVVPRRARRPVDATALRRAVAERLPDEMVPSRIVTMASLPKGHRDKVDRAALAPPEEATTGSPLGSWLWEQELQGIFAEVFGRRQVGLDDDFFDLGGHSLLALRVLTELEVVTDRRLPMSVLYEAPTVRSLARWVDGREDDTPRSVVPMSDDRPGAPLVLVPPPGDQVFCFDHLVDVLGTERRCLGLEAPGLDGLEPPFDDLDAMAATLVDRLGPDDCHFVGFCEGGLLAWAMAQQIAASGRRAPAVVLLDVGPRSEVGPRAVDWRVAARAARTGRSASTERLLAVREAGDRACRDYRPAPFDGQVLSVRCATADGTPPDRWLVRSAKELATVDLGCDHFELLEPPWVGRLAETIGVFLADR